MNEIYATIRGKEEVEQMRLKLRRRKRRIGMICGIMAVVVAGIVFAGGVGYAIIVAVVTGSVSWITLSQGEGKLRRLFREKIVRQFVETLLQNGSYDPARHHTLDEYYESLLYTTRVDRFQGANHVSGKYEKTQLSFSFLNAAYKRVEHTKNGKKVSYHTIFKGVFLCVDCNKNFSATTVVLPDFAEKYFGGLGKWMQEKAGNVAGEMVYMESPEFEKEFAVYSTDPVEARYLVTPKMQEDLLNVMRFLGKDVRFSFVNGKVFVAISRNDMFNVNTSRSFLDPETLKLHMKDLFDVLSVVRMLDLNVRIWGKKAVE